MRLIIVVVVPLIRKVSQDFCIGQRDDIIQPYEVKDHANIHSCYTFHRLYNKSVATARNINSNVLDGSLASFINKPVDP